MGRVDDRFVTARHPPARRVSEQASGAIELDRLVAVGDRSVQLSHARQDEPAHRIEAGLIRLEANRLIQIGQCSIIVIPIEPEPAAQPECVGVTRVRGDRSVEIVHRLVAGDNLIAPDPAGLEDIAHNQKYPLAVDLLSIQILRLSWTLTAFPLSSSGVSDAFRTT